MTEESFAKARVTEAELIEGARRGDEAAWASLMRQHQERVFRLAYLLVGDADDAEDVAQEDIVFLARRLVPHGRVSRIRYIVYVDPAQYDLVPDYATRFELARLIGRLNKRLKDECFILMGPGRWGSSNVELGLKVTYVQMQESFLTLLPSYSIPCILYPIIKLAFLFEHF